jgi:hypothetical protein
VIRAIDLECVHSTAVLATLIAEGLAIAKRSFEPSSLHHILDDTPYVLQYAVLPFVTYPLGLVPHGAHARRAPEFRHVSW